MKSRTLKQSRISFHRASIYVLFLLLIATPISVFAQDKDSIASLRQMGKAFSSIVKKASPAVVSLEAKLAVSRDSSTNREWPFDDDIFEYFFGPRTPRPRTPQRRSQQPVTSLGSGLGRHRQSRRLYPHE